jgi:guanidinobutyrase
VRAVALNTLVASLWIRIISSLSLFRVYLSFDVDGIDPSYAPGTGTPEVGGLTVPQALEVVRGMRGTHLVGCDLVEVAPAYDPSGNTALLAANLLFEMLCVLPRVKSR